MKFYYKILAVLMLLAVIALKWMDVDFGSNKGTQVKSITTSVEEVVAEYPDSPNAIEIESNDEYMSELEDLQNIREGKTEGTPVPMVTELDDLRNIQEESKKRKLAQQKAIKKKQVSNKTKKQINKDTIEQVEKSTSKQDENQSNEHRNEVIPDENETTSINEEDAATFNDEDKDIKILSDIIEEEDSSTGFYIDENGNVIEFDYKD